MDLLEKMATYVRVVDAHSFSAAARQIGISSAAVSRQMATLEAELGTTLLERTTRRMVVTPAGRRYYERCLRVLREVDDAQATGRGEGTHGLLRVNAPLGFGLACVAPHVHALMAKHPGLQVHLQLDDRALDLVPEGADLAIRLGPSVPASSEFAVRRLFSFCRLLVAAPAYLRRKGEPKSPEALAKHDALSQDGEPWALLDHEREVRVRLNVAFRSNALHAVRELAIQGAGIALLPAWFVREELAARALRVVLPAWQTEVVSVNAIQRSEQRDAPRARALLDHLRAAYAAEGGPATAMPGSRSSTQAAQ